MIDFEEYEIKNKTLLICEYNIKENLMKNLTSGTQNGAFGANYAFFARISVIFLFCVNLQINADRGKKQVKRRTMGERGEASAETSL